MKVFLIGFMGSGKTTAGKKLAAHLNRPFIDLDHVFERRYGSTIEAYFALYGEDAFRRAESELLKTTAYPDDAIISTGGGAPCFFDNIEWMNSQGLTIYIELPVKVLADRL
ncbi:MAG: shikimate kinase, partial [Mucilaginibacter polytrichastri]|nr:shikimate kinase [Mucilaginibacter polytrichastri]